MHVSTSRQDQATQLARRQADRATGGSASDRGPGAARQHAGSSSVPDLLSARATTRVTTTERYTHVATLQMKDARLAAAGSARRARRARASARSASSHGTLHASSGGPLFPAGPRPHRNPQVRVRGDALLRSQQQGEILSLLLGDPDRELSLTEISHLTGAPHPSVHREVLRAEQTGLVTSRKVGNTRLVRAQTDSPYYAGLADVLTKAFGPGHR
jgi:DNA-binding transcriptional ArsR family regulator